MGVNVVCGRNPADGKRVRITVEHGLVQSIEEARGSEEAWLAPGLIDLQVNGFAGSDLNADKLDPDVVVSLSERLVATGVTTYLPTLITDVEEKLEARLAAITAARRANQLVAHMVPSVHIEGPHISPEDGFRGAHPREHVRMPSVAEFDRWQSACGGIVGMVTMSPHYPNSCEYIAALVARGIHVAIGHTSADHQQIYRAVEAGARLSTHLGNGIALQLPRHPNTLWTQMAHDGLMATLIADGHHLPAETIKTIVRAKSISRSILISDSVALAGMPPGLYETAVGGRVELHPDGKLTMAEESLLAGATLPLKDALLKAMAMCDISLHEALPMATRNPGRFAGGRGKLCVGAPADIIRFTINSDHAALHLKTVMVQGKEWSSV